MAIQVELWQNTIKEELFKSNSFLNFLRNADEYVLAGKVVHIPQSGGPADVQKNRSVLPGVIVSRTDVDITYTIDEFTTDPFRISNADTVELSYDKTSSLIRENGGNLIEFVGDDLLYKLSENAPAGSKIATTGADRTATASGATGTRKRFTEADLRAAGLVLDKQNVQKDGRYVCLPPDFLNDLMSDNDLKYAFANVVDLPKGVIAKLFGFNILDRSSVLTLATDLTVKLPTAAAAATDNNAALFWQKDYLERAMGDVTLFDEYGRPEYYGDIFSMLVRMGGRACRQDNKGYGIIHEVA